MHPYQSAHYMPLDMKVNWTTTSGLATKTDTSKHSHIFVGDLSPDVEQQQLRDAFSPFGHISDCKIIRDPVTLKSKGYGFVSFVHKQDAERAMKAMNGQWLSSRPIRTNWATRKPIINQDRDSVKQLTYEEVFSQSSHSNCTVYCGGVLTGLTEELMRCTFNSYGTILEVRVFEDKGFAFVRFSTKEAAANAICSVHGTTVNDQVVKCSWGKESNDHTLRKTGGGMEGYIPVYGVQAGQYYTPLVYPGTSNMTLTSPAQHHSLQSAHVTPGYLPDYQHPGTMVGLQWRNNGPQLSSQQFVQQQLTQEQLTQQQLTQQQLTQQQLTQQQLTQQQLTEQHSSPQQGVITYWLQHGYLHQ